MIAFELQHVPRSPTMTPFLTLAIAAAAATATVVIGTAIPVLAASKRKGNTPDK